MSKTNTITMALLAGARPNYMKIFPIWREIKENHPELQPVLIHTGQHYDFSMSEVFFRDFQMPRPDHFLGIGSGTHGAQTGRIMIALEELFLRERPNMLVVVGDVNSTVAGALVAAKLGIPVAHVEAGLRSGDRTMPEEINRVVTDAISDWLLTSCRDADEHLKKEGIPAEKIRFVGNIMIDSLVHILPKARQSGMLGTLGLPSAGYGLVTLHRPSNVDDPAQLRHLMAELFRLADALPVVFPVHPRTRKMIEALALTSQLPQFKIIDPLGYLDFLCLESHAAVVITDSGGIQEETTFLGVPCLTLRPNTERPITIREGTNRLVNVDSQDLMAEAKAAMARRPPAPPTLEQWDGRSAGRIVAVLQEAVALATVMKK